MNNSHQNPLSKQRALVTKVRALVESEYKIHKFDLMDRMGMTLGEYNKYAGYLKHKLNGIVEYNKQTKEWILVAKVEDKEDPKSLSEVIKNA